MLTVKLSGNDFWLPILILLGVNDPSCLPRAAIFVTNLPEFCPSLIVTHPLRCKVRSLCYRIVTQSITGIAVIYGYQSLRACLLAQFVIIIGCGRPVVFP